MLSRAAPRERAVEDLGYGEDIRQEQVAVELLHLAANRSERAYRVAGTARVEGDGRGIVLAQREIHHGTRRFSEFQIATVLHHSYDLIRGAFSKEAKLPSNDVGFGAGPEPVGHRLVDYGYRRGLGQVQAAEIAPRAQGNAEGLEVARFHAIQRVSTPCPSPPERSPSSTTVRAETF